MLALSMYTFILVCSLSNLLLNEYDDDDDDDDGCESPAHLGDLMSSTS